jgi:DNA-binding NarL/FixJ family response regulator
MPPDHTPITVLLVEDHLLVSEGLAAIINATGDLKVVGTAATAAEAVRQAVLQQPDVVVMDSHLPTGAVRKSRVASARVSQRCRSSFSALTKARWR